jgi:hypothetical protein
MPSDKPVGVWGFVEERCAKGNCKIAEDAARNFHQGWRLREFGDGPKGQDVARSGPTAFQILFREFRGDGEQVGRSKNF